MEKQLEGKRTGKILAAAVVVSTWLLVAVFLFFDRHNAISSSIQSWGILGVGLAIIVMAFFCSTPIPSEGLLMMYFKVYGVELGLLYAWLGSILSAYMILFVARRLGTPVLARWISDVRLQLVNDWVRKKGKSGLLIARLLPIPAFLMNYAIGSIRAVRGWDYLWTSAVTMIPYYAGTALIYLGLSTRYVVWLVMGAIALIPLWMAGYYLMKAQSNKHTEPSTMTPASESSDPE